MGRCNTNIHLRNEKSKLKRNKIRPFQAFYTDQCLHRIQKTKMAAGQGEKFCLRWNDFEKNISSSFRELRDDKDFFDVTLACDENQLQAHKVILSACSPFFRSVLKKNPHQHPLLYLKGVKYEDIQVKGLTQTGQKKPQPTTQSMPATKRPPPEQSPASNAMPINKPPKQPRIRTSYEHAIASTPHTRGIEDFTPAPIIKTEAQVVDVDCDLKVSTDHQLVQQSSDYPADQDGYEYQQNYQEQDVVYEEQMGHMGDRDTSQDF